MPQHRRGRRARRATFVDPQIQQSTRRAALTAESRRVAHELPRRRGRSGQTTGFAATASALVVALFIATTVPANAVSPERPETASSSITHGTPQTIRLPQAASTVTVSRDPASATSEVELTALAKQDPAGLLVSNTLGPIQWPFPGQVPISDGFGLRSAPCSGCSSNHKGLDMTPGGGTPIRAIADGIVRSAEESDVGFGVNVVLDHRVNGERFASLYAHMQYGSLQVKAGDQVRVGQVIGRVGTTGASTGNHLHLEIWDDGTTPIEPYAWLRARAR